MIFILFYILSYIPRFIYVFFIDLFIYLRLYKITKSYKITKINLKIAFPELTLSNIELLSRRSIRESIMSGYETVFSWGRSFSDSNNLIFKIENNFLLKRNIISGQGLICVAIHNRSVDFEKKVLCSVLINRSRRSWIELPKQLAEPIFLVGRLERHGRGLGPQSAALFI